MRFGITAGSIGPNVDPGAAAQFARSAEDAGFDSIWVPEHVVLPSAYESPYPFDASGKLPAPCDVAIPDPLIWLAYVAASTTRLRLATGILILPQRNPVVLAKELATLDHLSGGRVDLGVGVGWLREEFNAIGVPWAGRGKRADEYLEAMQALWGDGAADFDGEFVRFSGVHCNPKPVTGSVRFHIGGGSEASARRAGRLGDGFVPFEFAPEVPALIDVMRREAERCGRDPDGFEITTGLPDVAESELPATLDRLEAAGVTRVLVQSIPFFGPDQDQRIEDFGERFIDPDQRPEPVGAPHAG